MALVPNYNDPKFQTLSYISSGTNISWLCFYLCFYFVCMCFYLCLLTSGAYEALFLSFSADHFCSKKVNLEPSWKWTPRRKQVNHIFSKLHNLIEITYFNFSLTPFKKSLDYVYGYQRKLEMMRLGMQPLCSLN